MTLEGIFGVAVDVSSSLIILFTIFGAFLQYSGAGKFYHRLLVLGDGRQAHRRRPHRGAGLVPARRAVGLGRRDHGDARLGRLSDAREGRLREERRRRAARRRRPGRDHLAAGARRRRVPDRRVPEDLVPRRAADGGDPDAAVLSRAVPDGRDRRAQVRHARRRRSRRSTRVLDADAQRYWFHFLSLVSIVVFMLLGFSPVLSVFWATVVALATSFLRRDTRADSLRPVPRQGLGDASTCCSRGFVKALEGGSLGMLNVARHLRRRRHHRRRRHADRPRPEVQLDRDRLRRRLAAADRDLHRARRVDRRPRGAGDRVATSSAR